MDELRELIPEEARVRGYILLYADTPKAVESAVKAYNLQMLEWRKMVKKANRCRNVIQVLTPFVWAVMMFFGLGGPEAMDMLGNYIGFNNCFWNIPWCIAAMAAFAPVYIYFGFLNDRILVVSAASAFLISVKPYAALLLCVNMLMYYLYRRNTDPIRLELEYHKFNTIDIKYQRFNDPGFDRKFT